MHLVYRPHHNPLIEAVIRSRRESHIEHAIPRTDIRALIRSLRGNHAVWYAPDQGYRGKHSVMVPFFGIPAPSAAPTARIAKLSGTAILPFFVKRLPGRQGYLLRIEPPLEDFPTDDSVAGTQRFHHMLERLIRQAPEQYLWTHDRFKFVPR
jgi:KDO2-lipid IV(A) lauroyltransferase